MDVSVLVPVLDEARHIRDSVASMTAQRLDGELEVLLLDGGSTDGTRAILDELAAGDPRLRVLDNPAGTIPAALNLGLRHARGTFIVRMDAHSRYPRDYVALGVERLRRGDVDWVAGPVIPVGDGRWSRRAARALTLGLGQGGSRKWRARVDAGAEWELDEGVFTGVWRRETLAALHGWDEAFPVGEDSEMAVRVLGRGGRIVCLPAMAAEYTARDSLRGLFLQYWRFGRVRVRMGARHPDALRRSHLASAALVASLGGLAARRTRRPTVLAWAAYAALIGSAAQRGARDLPPPDRAGVAVALATMHVGWGGGFLAGCLRDGPPWRAMARALRRRGGR